PAEPWDEAGLGPPLNSSEIGAVLRERRNISWQARVDSRDPRVLAPDLIAVRIAKPFNGRPAGAESEILIGDAFQQLEAGRLRARRNSNGFVTFILDEPPYEFPAYSSRENPDLARLPVLTEANAGRALDRSGIVVALSMAEARGLEFEDVVVGHKLTRTPIFYLKEIADLDARKSARNKRLRVYWHPDSGQFHYFMDEPKQHMELPGILSAGLPILVGASPILSFLRHVISPVMADLPAVVVGMIAAASLAVFHPAVRSRAAFLFHAA
ncbi:MAG TPA: hypothetical protein VMU17_08300, partial [Elusimicrobiota bacterium]|nr:hypothetical protein [Elusimicrobiota bacterium]